MHLTVEQASVTECRGLAVSVVERVNVVSIANSRGRLGIVALPLEAFCILMHGGPLCVEAPQRRLRFQTVYLCCHCDEDLSPLELACMLLAPFAANKIATFSFPAQP